METLLRAFQAEGHQVFVAGTAAGLGITLELVEGVAKWRVGLRNVYFPRPDRQRPVWLRRLWHLLDIYNLAMRLPLGHILDEVKPDVVFVHNLPGWSIAAIGAMRGRGIPVVQILHDYYNICVNTMMFKNGKNCVGQCLECRVMRAPHRWLTNNVDAVVGVSRFVLERHLAFGAFRDVKVKRVIHNVRSAADLGLNEAPALRAKHLAERGDVRIRFGFIGTLAPSKGIEVLLEAFAGLENERAELWVAGRGKPDFVTYLKDKYGGKRVRFLGQMKPKDFFTGIDVTVVPSLWEENFPGVISESFAFGVPVIGARRGGIPEMITEGENGVLLEPGREYELRRVLSELSVRRPDVQRMSAAALQASGRFLDVASWGANYLGIASAVQTGRASTPAAAPR